MSPARFALGLSISITAALYLVWRGEMDYLHRYWALIFRAHWQWLALAAVTWLASWYALFYLAARKIGFGDLGRRVQHAEREMLAGRGHDEELARRLRRERRGDF